MKKLLVILISVCVTLTTGFPQGYNYNQPQLPIQSHSNTHSHSHVGSQIHSSVLTPSHSQVLHSHLQKQQLLRPSSNNLLPSVSSSNSGGYNYGRPTPPQITKNIYIHTAPEEPEEYEPHEVVMGSTRKHYKIIFIRAPVQKIPKLSIVPQKQEDKTLIYVLSKKTDASDIQIDSGAIPTEPSKPEVYFIKYKTPEEALSAQNQIQAHYDKLGGTTQISDEGIAPIQSVIGAYNNNNSELLSGNHLSSIALTPQHNYLPPRL